METPKQKPVRNVILLVVIGVIVVWLIFAFFQERQLQSRTETLKRERVALRQKLENINDLLEHGPRPIIGAALTLNGPGQVYAYLYETSRRSNMSMEKVVILPENLNGLQRVIPTEITLSGSYPAMLIFLERMAQNQLLGNMKRIEIHETDAARDYSLTVFIALSLPISKEARL
jgi:Tfp pilus assembly protein PilO